MKTFIRLNKKANKFHDYYLLGNGKIGVAENGGSSKSKIVINEETFWSGYEGIKKHKKSPDGILDDIRSAMDSNDLDKAHRLVHDEIAGEDVESYIPLGSLVINKGWGISKKYERILDIDNAIHTVNYILRDCSFNEESFVSHPDHVYVKKIKTNEKVAFDIRFESSLNFKIRRSHNIVFVHGYAPSHVVFHDVFSSHPIVYDKTKKTVEFVLVFKIVGNAESLYDIENGIHVINTTETVLYCTAKTTFARSVDIHDLEQECLEILDKAIEKGYESVKEAHIADYKSLYDRVEFSLNNVESSPADTKKALKLSNKTGKGYDALAVTLYNFGRYLMISGSREDSQMPLNLQGKWNNETRPKWACDYTVNINTQMNYWLADACNLPECILPLRRFLERLMENGETTAKETFHIKNGWTMGHNTDLWAHTGPVGGDFSIDSCKWSLFMGAAGWFSNMLFDHYLYTLDKKFLADSFPVIEGAVKFYLDYTYVDKATGSLVCGPEISPENTYISGEKGYQIDKAPAITMSIIRELYANYLETLKILGKSGSLKDRVEKDINKLFAYKVSDRGRIQEWSQDYKEAEPNHRHLSHLYGLYPGHEISVDKPDLYEAARKSIDARGEDGTGWALAWKVCLWARLKDGEHAYSILKNQFRLSGGISRTGGSYASLLGAHPPFQIDSNFGAVAGINEMLVQSYNGKTEFLPAIPKEWANGHIKGLKIHGNKTIDIVWEQGKITQKTIR